MFVRTNLSRHNYRLARSIARLPGPFDIPCPLRTLPIRIPESSPLAPGRPLSTRPGPRSWRRASSPRPNAAHLSERSLATAVGDTTGDSAPEHQQYHIQPFDPSAIVVVPDPKRRPPSGRSTTTGVPGDIEVAVPVFEACLRVGKLERASLVLNRLEKLNVLDPEQLMDMNNQYLEAWLTRIRCDPGVGKAEELHAWYEVHIQQPKLPQTPETIAYMLKASLLTTPNEGTRLDRLIKRYMGMVPADQGLDVLYCTDILSDSDIAAITSSYPEFNIPSFDDVEDFQDSSASVAEDGSVSDTTSTHVDVAADGSSVPEVRETPQKGGGLAAIKSTLAVLKQLRDGSDISKLPPLERREFQSRLEKDCVDAAMQRWRHTDEELRKMGLNTFMSASSMSSKLWTWQQDLEEYLKQEFKKVQEAEKAAKKSEADMDRCIWGPLLMQSTPARLAAVTILTTLNCLAQSGVERGVPLSLVINYLSRSAEEDIHYLRQEEEQKNELLKGRVEWIRQRQLRAAAKNQAAAAEGQAAAAEGQEVAAEGQEAAAEGQDAAAEGQAAAEGETSVGAEGSVPRLATSTLNDQKRLRQWPVAIRAKVGATLLSGLAGVAKVRVVREHSVTKEKVSSMQPALAHSHRFKRGRKIGVLMAHPVLVEMMRKEPRADFLARHLPMVVEPQPWSRFDKGGYLESPVALVRIKPGEQDQRMYAEAAIAQGDVQQILKGLDVLGKTAWRINRPVFEVFLEAWNTGEALAKIPPLHPDIPVPPEPAATADPLARRVWLKALKQAQNQKTAYHSIRCFMNFQLEIARAFRDQEFFFPHNIDFRGRAYPIPTYLNHMGADHVRGLLRFSKGKELGEKGLMWLKVHLANVFGFDKASLKEREAFAMGNLENISDSVNNPLNGQRWWLEAEDPWQCLATCFELKAAMESPDPTKFVSALPVHQDGTCNGLQHYAALGGDTWGARQVNLAPGDKPADVYSAVAKMVNDSMEQDAELGDRLALALRDKIKRKVVKQTVMTNVYGVTFSGAKKQVLRQIDALYPKFEDETGLQAGLASSYITTKIFKALSTMFKGAHDIQYWLGEIGGRVCRALTAEQLLELTQEWGEKGTKFTTAKGSNKIIREVVEQYRSTIIWTTPLRMPVVQPYRKNSSKIIKTCMQSLILRNPDHFDPVNRRKQLQAFPPNFIHSLDASHMLLSALECHARGLTFAAVHDSFWTHAADVDVMNSVLRDAFIRIHSEDVIKRLLSEFEARYKGGLYSARVDKSTKAGKAIYEWRQSKKTKINTRDEILLEKKRIDLLNSDDPEERKEGEAMVTPASIYAKFASETGAEVVQEDLTVSTLGSMAPSTGSGDPDDGDMLEGAAPDEDAMGGEDGDIVAPPEPQAELDAEAEADAEANAEADEEQQVQDVDTPAGGEPAYAEKYTKLSYFAERIGTQKIKTKPKTLVMVWLPLSFPAVPKKGDFDVTQLRESHYFFS